MAVPAFIDSQTSDSAGATTITFDMSTITHAADDLLIAFVKQSENTGQQTWDDDGGGGQGWSRISYNRTTGGRDQETAVYWKFTTSSAELDPTFDWDSGGTNEPMSGALLVYRGVDLFEPYTEITWQWSPNDANPPNPDVRIDYANTRVVCCHNATHDDISAVAAPTGFTLRTQVWNGLADDHRNHFTADIEVDTVGTYSPPDWQHSVLNSVPEYQCYSIALNESQPIHVTGGTALNSFDWGDLNLTVTGDGFEASQATGKVEFWSDTIGTIKTVQTIDSWSDTSIQIDTVQGSLGNNTSVYLVVTNDSGDVSAPKLVVVGLTNYTAAVQNLSPDHYWTLSEDYEDSGITGPSRPMKSGLVGAGGVDNNHPWAAPITEDANATSGSMYFDDILDRREIADSDNMNITITANERTVAGWIQLDGIQQSMGAIWKEGGGVQNLAFLIGIGNILIGQMADTPGNIGNVQAFADFALSPNRPYHICQRYSINESPGEFRLFIDGVEQTRTDGNPFGAGTFDSHGGDVGWGNSDADLETGGTNIAYAGQVGCKYAHWASWSDNSAYSGSLHKTNDIRKVLFERGAIPDLIISSSTEAGMQAQLDLIADTVRPNWPLGIRVEIVTGGGNFELIADNITFDPLVSCDVQYLGVDTLTWVNINGSSISSTNLSTPKDGTITIEDVPKLTITGIQTGTEVRVYTAGTQTELTGIENVTSGTFEAYLRETSIDIQIVSLDFRIERFESIDMTSGDVGIPLQQFTDRVYSNP